MRRGAIVRWEADGSVRHLVTHERSVTVRAADGIADSFLLGLWAGMSAFGPLDVEMDYRHSLSVHGRVVVPSLSVTPRTLSDLRASAFALDPFGRIHIRTTDDGDIHAEVTT
jgi:hypothetical protein